MGVGLSLAAGGAAVPALAVCVLGSFVHFVGDKIVRPILVGDAVKLGFVWVLIASLGGLEVLGLLGVLLGPVVLALASSLWREWATQHEDHPGPSRHASEYGARAANSPELPEGPATAVDTDVRVR